LDVIDVTGVCDEMVVVLPYASTCIDGYVYDPGVIVLIVARSNVTLPDVLDCVILVFEFAVIELTEVDGPVFALSNAACVNAVTVVILDVILLLITELAESALADISPLKIITLAEMLVLITELADAALAVI